MKLTERCPRLIKRMRSTSQALFISALAAILVISAVACPLWMGLLSDCSMPGSNESDDAPDQCPMSICLASSPYLASHVSANFPQLKELPVEAVISTALLSSSVSAAPYQMADGAPPGLSSPIFLRTRSLLI